MIESGRISRPALVYLASGITAGAFLLIVLRNVGLFPVVFGDEYFYSYFSRLAPLVESPRPSYLYFLLYGVTSSCGEGFLECARIINALFVVSALPFIYLVGRRVATRGVAILVSSISVLGPINTYSAYFMPEAMYFFGFWIFVWIALEGRDRSWLIYSSAIGISLGLLALVKAHAVFLLPGIWLFEMLVRRRDGWKAATRASLRVFFMSAVIFLGVRLELGYLFAGARGLSLLGSDYTSIGLSANGETATYLVSLARGTLTSLAGHLLGLTLLFSVPIAITFRYPDPNESTGDVEVRKREIIGLAAAFSVVLLAVTAAFTAKVVNPETGESIWRVHARYYNFIFPLFFLIAASQLDAERQPALSKWPLVGTAIGVVFVLVAYPVFSSYYSPSVIDSPELRGVTMKPTVGWVVTTLGAFCLTLWAWSTRIGSAVYLFVFVPLVFGAGTVLTSRELRTRMVANSVDHAGELARIVLGDGVSKLVVVGSEPAPLYRAQFHVDNPTTTQLLLKPDEPLRFCAIPADRDWVLLLGNHKTDFDRHRQIAMQDYALISLRDSIEAKFSDQTWTLPFRAQGVSRAESWGRWSEGERVTLRFDFPLPKKSRITLVAQAFGPNVGEPFVFRLGDQKKVFRLGETAQAVVFNFDTDGSERTIEIEVPHPTSPSKLGIGADPRQLGIGLTRIKVEGASPETARQCAQTQ